VTAVVMVQVPMTPVVAHDETSTEGEGQEALLMTRPAPVTLLVEQAKVAVLLQLMEVRPPQEDAATANTARRSSRVMDYLGEGLLREWRRACSVGVRLTGVKQLFSLGVMGLL
jgi:hypothetical protein